MKNNPEYIVEPISLGDFSVEYKGITLNQDTSLKDLGTALNVDLSQGKNIELRAASYIKKFSRDKIIQAVL